MDDNEEKEIERVTALLHERKAKMLELLRAEPALKPEEQAAVVYALAIEPGISRYIPAVIMARQAAHREQA